MHITSQGFFFFLGGGGKNYDPWTTHAISDQRLTLTFLRCSVMNSYNRRSDSNLSICFLLYTYGHGEVDTNARVVCCD